MSTLKSKAVWNSATKEPHHEHERRHGPNQVGRAITVDELRIPPACRSAIQQLAVAVEPRQGFYDFGCYGAGLHLMPPGTALGTHTDATHHPLQPWKRLESLVYFLDTCEGGELIVEGKRIAAEAGNAVRFQANRQHEVLTTRTTRRTLSLFVREIDDGTKTSTRAEF